MTDEELVEALDDAERKLGAAIHNSLLQSFESQPRVAEHLAAEPNRSDGHAHLEWAHTLSNMATFRADELYPALCHGPTLGQPDQIGENPGLCNQSVNPQEV